MEKSSSQASSSSSGSVVIDGEGERAAENNNNNWVEDLQQTVMQSKNSAYRSALSFYQHSSSHLRSFQQDEVPRAISQFKTFHDAFFNNAKEELRRAVENPVAAIGVSLTAALILLPGPRRFLFRHTLGRLQSEEARFLRAEKKVMEFNQSVNLMKNESKKLLERAASAEKEMKHGQTELMDAGSQIQQLAKSLYKLETQAADLMYGLREVPGRDSLKLRAEVASMASLVKWQRIALNKRIIKISELGLPV